MITWTDHLLAVLMLGVWPAYIARFGKRDLAEMAQPGGREKAFRSTFMIQWLHAAVLIGLWAWAGRSWTSLGLSFELDLGFAIVAVLAAAMLIQTAQQIGKARSEPRFREQLAEQVAPLEAMMPRSQAELRQFDRLAWTAGVCEELAYRGYLLWYLQHWVPLWAAVLLASLAFGAVHLYEGRSAAARIAVLAAISCGLYLGSGSLWIPIVVHAVFDMLQVRLALVGLEPPTGSAEAIELPGEPGA